MQLCQRSRLKFNRIVLTSKFVFLMRAMFSVDLNCVCVRTGLDVRLRQVGAMRDVATESYVKSSMGVEEGEGDEELLRPGGTKSEAEGEKQTARSREGNGQLGRWRERKSQGEGQERTARSMERNEEPG